MKKSFKALGVATLLTAAPSFMGNAQYYSIANQVTSMLQPALSGSFMYKGLVEAEYLQGVGTNSANFVNVTTSQGFQYSNWFYMGVGAGVEGVFAHAPAAFQESYGNNDTTDSGVMIPLFLTSVSTLATATVNQHPSSST